MENSKLRDCLIEWMEQEEKKLNEELQNIEPHIFSEKYKKKKEEILHAQEGA